MRTATITPGRWATDPAWLRLTYACPQCGLSTQGVPDVGERYPEGGYCETTDGAAAAIALMAESRSRGGCARGNRWRRENGLPESRARRIGRRERDS